MPTTQQVSELSAAIDRYLAELGRQNASPHTIRNYASDLAQLLEYFSPPGASAPALGEIKASTLREWLTNLFDRGLDALSIRRKLAAVRSLFQFLLRERTIQTNVARQLRTPKAPKRIPPIPTAEQTNALIEGVEAELTKKARLGRPHPERDLLIFELLYGCGLRVGELCGLNLEDFDPRERWIRVRGKGRKERQVPYGSKVAAALENYLAVRGAQPGQNALFISDRGARLADRRAREIVKFYARMIAADLRSIHIVCVTHLPRTCCRRAPICARFRSCWGMRSWLQRRSIRKFRSPI